MARYMQRSIGGKGGGMVPGTLKETSLARVMADGSENEAVELGCGAS